MQKKRKADREKRYKNRIRIGLMLIGISLLLSIAGYFIIGSLVFFMGFFIPVGAIYLFAGWWEKKELEKAA